MNFLKIGSTPVEIPLAVEFKGINLNQCYQLLDSSKVKTAFDPSWSNVFELNTIPERLTSIYGEIKDLLATDSENIEKLKSKLNELKSIKTDLNNFGFSPEYLLEQTNSLNGAIDAVSCYVGSSGARLLSSCSINSVESALDLAIEDPVKPLGPLQKIWNVFLSNYHINRAYAFAAANNIDEKDIYETSYDWLPTIDKSTGLPKGKVGTSFQVIVYQLKKDAYGNNIELKHVFRQHKKGVFLATSSDNDNLNLPWDNYWTQEGELILNENDLSEPIIDASGILPVGGFSKVAAGVKLAGSASKTWSVYTFMTTTGKYWRMTTDYVRRMNQHGARIVGRPRELIENIPDKLTARGVEQLFINFGVKTRIITKQINSINPKRTERYNQAIKQAKDFLNKNYPGEFTEILK